jgi:Tfp pilus assembly protein PilO
MKQTSKRLTSILIAIFFVIIAIIILFDWIEPEYSNMMTIKAQLLGEQAFLSSEQQTATQVKNLVSSYETQSQSAAATNIALAIPPSQDLAGALAQIYGLAQASGLTVSGVGISAPSVSGSQITSSSTATIQPLNRISFQVSAAGSYEALKNFVSSLETNVRIFDLKSFSMNSISSASSGGRSGNANSQDFFSYSFSVATYYQ